MRPVMPKNIRIWLEPEFHVIKENTAIKCVNDLRIKNESKLKI
jgi:hypothetical protein